MQRLRRNVGAIRPPDTATIHEEPPEEIEVLQRLKHRSFEPSPKVDGPLGAIVEHEVNAKAPRYFASTTDGRKVMVEDYSSGFDALKRLTGCDASPACIELTSVQRYQTLDPPTGGS